MKILTFIRDVLTVIWWEASSSIEAGCSPRTTIRYIWWAYSECFIAHTHMTPSEMRAYIDDWYAGDAAAYDEACE